MKSILVPITCLIMLIFPLDFAWSETIMIETQIRVPQVDMNLNEKIRIESMESGLMDVIFDNGHIFFNKYVLADTGENALSEEQQIVNFEQSSSDYLLRLIPDEFGVRWSFYQYNRENPKQEDYDNLSQIDQKLNDRKKWLELGRVIGQRIVDNIEGVR